MKTYQCLKSYYDNAVCVIHIVELNLQYVVIDLPFGLE